MRTIAYWASLALIFTMPWENLFDLGALGTIARATGLFLGGLWLCTLLVSGRFRRPNVYHAIVLIFFCWNALTLLWTVDLEKTMENVLTYLQLIGLILVLWDLYTSWTAVRAGLQAYVLGSYVSAVSVVLDYTKGGASVYQARYTAVGFDENDIGLILALGVPIAWYLATLARSDQRSYASRFVNYLYIPVAVLAISLTASRAAFLTLLPALVFILVSFTRIKLYARVLVFAGLFGVFVSLPAVVPQAAMQRLETTGNEMTEGDFNGRMRIWREGLVAFQGHPFVGSGSGAFKTAIVPIMSPPPKAAHNFVLCYLVECGIIGLGLFMVVLWMTFADARRQPTWISRMWLTILTMWLMGASSHNWELRKQTWLLFSFMVIGAHLPFLEFLPPERASQKGQIQSQSGQWAMESHV